MGREVEAGASKKISYVVKAKDMGPSGCLLPGQTVLTRESITLPFPILLSST